MTLGVLTIAFNILPFLCGNDKNLMAGLKLIGAGLLFELAVIPSLFGNSYNFMQRFPFCN